MIHEFAKLSSRNFALIIIILIIVYLCNVIWRVRAEVAVTFRGENVSVQVERGNHVLPRYPRRRYLQV